MPAVGLGAGGGSGRHGEGGSEGASPESLLVAAARCSAASWAVRGSGSPLLPLAVTGVETPRGAAAEGYLQLDRRSLLQLVQSTSV